MKKTSLLGKILTFAILAMFAFIILFPMLFVIFASFKTNMELMSGTVTFFPKEFTFNNYKEVFQSENFDFVRMLLNSIYYTVISVVITVVMSSLLAYVFERGEFSLKKPLFAVFSALMFINYGGITTYAVFEVLKFLHIPVSLNGLLIRKLIGINVVQMYLVKSYIATLPKDLDEAAEIDGCTFLGIFFKIILPLLKPIIATISILAFNSSWNDYLMPTVYTVTHPEQRTLIVGLMELKNSSSSVTAWNVLFAGTILSLLPVLIAYCFGNKFFMDGLTEGAIKG